MVTNKENLFKLGKKMTDRIPYKLGLKPMTEDCPEYWGMANVLTDEMVEVALTMKQRTPTSLQEFVERTGKDEQHLEALLQEMATVGLLEYGWEGKEHTRENKRYILPLFVPGAAELFNMNNKVVSEHPEVCNFFERMTRLPLEGLTEMIPPGGAGVGMHVIPVEKAIPAQAQSLSIEHISHWLKKYEGHIGVGVCSCRRAQSVRGEGSGDVESEWCIGVGDFADYVNEVGTGRPISYEEAMEILQKAEDNGYVHQITNIDGENKIFAICNCAPGVCYALRTSQLFNTPNMSRSAYIAHVDKENCVACGKCVEVCPAGAVKLGQKLCTKEGPVVYPKQELPDAVKWGKEKWNENYRDDNRINCHQTGTAPCKTKCPAHIAVQGYIKMAAQGRYMDALKLIKQDNPFPAVCGSICNRQCEDACTRGSIDRAVAIDEIKKFIAEQELHAEKRYIPKVISKRSENEPYKEKIAVIGAGPAGMSCAYYLANMSYPVTVFDKNPVPGGMLTLGIPSFRLEKDVVNAEIEVLKEMGVEFKCGVEVGKDVTIDELRRQGYKGFYLAIGAQKSAPIGVPGEELQGVYGGVDFLRRVNLGEKPEIGEKCAVIGGGNVAMDVCRTALRLGAKDTFIIYRRGQEEMPADKDEVAEAMEEGVQFRFLCAPAEILGTDGKVSGLKVEKMALGEPDEKGRRKPVGTGEFEMIEVSSVIGAIGQKVDLGGIAPEGMTFNPNGTVIAEALTYQTAQPDIFAGGDVVTGPKFAIDAIAAGHEAAISLHRFVHKGQSLTLARNRRDFIQLDKENLAIPVESFDNAQRQVAGHDKAKAKTFANDRVTFTEEQVKKEAARCLGCGASIVDSNRCIGCGLCTTKCEFDAIHLSRDMPEASRMVKAEDKLKAIAPYMAKRQIKILRNRNK
ncbi:MAG: FAD-dependent oxidoreductase [Candidatus Limivicinus sp.]|nr:FAD-dependent oxidoreductase [Clostridiales bacterium]MDY6133026.1 FAD-dependent oxidoreductase [Candidatus Limivicinus sp.]